MTESKATLHSHHAGSTDNLQQEVNKPAAEAKPQPNVQNQAEESKKPAAEAPQKEEVKAETKPEPAAKEAPASKDAAPA